MKLSRKIKIATLSSIIIYPTLYFIYLYTPFWNTHGMKLICDIKGCNLFHIDTSHYAFIISYLIIAKIIAFIYFIICLNKVVYYCIDNWYRLDNYINSLDK